jgi:hypothetical protein
MAIATDHIKILVLAFLDPEEVITKLRQNVVFSWRRDGIPQKA